MGFMESIREALGAGDEHPDGAAPTDGTATQVTAHVTAHITAHLSTPPRHLDPDAPAENPEDAHLATGGKHAARDY